MLKRFLDLQSRVKAPKTEKNGFAKFSYRNLEKMLEANAKTFEEFKVSVLFDDEIVPVGDRLFLKSTIVARSEDTESDDYHETETACGWAEIPLVLGSMSAPQITGSASSYARKYAFCNLFAIDGSEDVDSLEQKTPQQDAESVAKLLKDAAAANDKERFTALVRTYWGGYQTHAVFKTAVDDGMKVLGIEKKK